MKEFVKRRRSLSETGSVFLLATAAMAGSNAAIARVTEAAVPARHSIMPVDAPLYFEANHGQLENGFEFIARGRDCDVLIAPTEALLVLCRQDEPSSALDLGRVEVGGQGAFQMRPLRFRLEGANPRAAASGLHELAGRGNYFIGNDPSAWQAGLPLFSKVQIDQVYPGVRLVYYADESARLEYDFVLEPGTQPDRISWRIEGADKVMVDAAGNLTVKLGDEEIRQHKPVIYQMAQGIRKQIEGGYRMKGETGVGFWVGEYDRHSPLVIDPSLTFSAYLGGKGRDRGWGIATDGNGNVWVAGETLSVGLRTTNLLATNAPLRARFQGARSVFGDGFVAKFNNQTELVYLTYLGGIGQDAAFAIAADTNGAAYVTGYTDSPNFPIFPKHTAFQRHLGGTNLNVQGVFPIDAFVTKLNSDGTLAYSTYLGGRNRDVGLGIAVDNQGRAYVTGLTESADFPTKNALQLQITNASGTNIYNGSKYHRSGDAFVTRINPDGTALEYSTFLGGESRDIGQGIALDSVDNAWVVGITSSTKFPTANVPTTSALWSFLNGQPNHALFTDGFVSKLSATGDTLLFSSYLGGDRNDAALAVTVDPSGNAYVTGYTFSTNFPVTSTNLWPIQTNISSEVFVTSFNSDGATNYSVVFGGRKREEGIGIAVDANANAYIVGVTSSTNDFAGVNFTNMMAFFSNNPTSFFTATNSSLRKFGTSDAFIVQVDASGSNVFSAYFGGRGNDQANGIAWDPTANAAYIVGTTTSSTNFLSTSPGTFHGSRIHSDAFVGRIQFP